MVKSDMEEIVLAKLKTTSRFAKRETSSGKYKDYYKLGCGPANKDWGACR